MIKLNLKTTLVFCVLLAIHVSTVRSQTYTWMKGSNSYDQSGLYGTLGVPASTNNPGGRSGATTWKDASGNFWLFGGSGFDAFGNNDFLNDLWKYTLSTNEWTWIAGDSLVYQSGIYGTLGVPSSLNKPGSRAGAASWTDAAGNLWMFGGYGVDAFSSDDVLNDLWKYNISTNQWTWMKGSNANNPYGTFGTQGVAATANTPGGSLLGVSWTDASGNFWLFSGQGNNGTNTNPQGALHDLWKYTVSTNQWTWVNGSGLTDQDGAYGTLGTAAPSNIPGGRFIASGWADALGNLWVFGGLGLDATASSSNYDALNDLWKYTITTNQWTWVNGSNTAGQGGTYGTLGTPATSNIPGGRMGHMSWTDASNGDFYLFGGTGYFSTSQDDMNDLWKYSPTSNQWTWLKGSNNAATNGTYGTLGTAASPNTPGSRSVLAGWTDNLNNLWLFGGDGVPANITDYGNMNDLWKLSNCAAPVLTVSANHGPICKGESVTITAGGATSYTWNTTPVVQTNSIHVSPALTTTYIVTGSNGGGCQAVFNFTQLVNDCAGISGNSKSETFFKIYPNPSNGEFNVRASSQQGTSILIFNALGQKVFEQDLNSEQTLLQTGLQKGIYFYQLNNSAKSDAGKLIIE